MIAYPHSIKMYGKYRESLYHNHWYICKQQTIGLISLYLWVFSILKWRHLPIWLFFDWWKHPLITIKFSAGIFQFLKRLPWCFSFSFRPIKDTTPPYLWHKLLHLRSMNSSIFFGFDLLMENKFGCSSLCHLSRVHNPSSGPLFSFFPDFVGFSPRFFWISAGKVFLQQCHLSQLHFTSLSLLWPTSWHLTFCLSLFMFPSNWISPRNEPLKSWMSFHLHLQHSTYLAWHISARPLVPPFLKIPPKYSKLYKM